MAGDVIMESVLYQTLIDVMVLEIAVIAVTSKIVQVSSLLTLTACAEGYRVSLVCVSVCLKCPALSQKLFITLTSVLVVAI